MIHNFTNSINNDLSALPYMTDNRPQINVDNPIYRVHNTSSSDVAFALKMAREMINVNGANINIYPRTFNNDIDDVWDDDPDPTYYSPCNLAGYFVPQPMERELTKWGVDVENSIDVVFCREHVYDKMKDRLLIAGDLLEIPYNSQMSRRPKYYRVENAFESGNYRYQWLYITCQAKLLTGDPTVKPHTDSKTYYIDYNREVGGRSGSA